MTSRAFRLCMVCAVCLLPMMVHAGAVANLTQIEFESGQTTFAPGSKGTVRFMASDYAFGGGQFAYLTIAVVPIGSPLHNPQPTDTVEWDVYGVLIRTPAMPTFAEAASPYEVSFVAPLKPGEYHLVWGQVLSFFSLPLNQNAEPKKAFLASGDERNSLVKTLLDNTESIKAFR